MLQFIAEMITVVTEIGGNYEKVYRRRFNFSISDRCRDACSSGNAVGVFGCTGRKGTGRSTEDRRERRYFLR